MMKIAGNLNDPAFLWEENKNELFAQRLGGLIEVLDEAGFSEREIKRMVGTFPFVRMWAGTPVWMRPVKKLPKGLRWKDGKTYKDSCKRNITFLPDGTRLFVRGIGLPGTKIKDRYAVIEDWRGLTAVEAAYGAGWGNPDWADCIAKFWRENGLSAGHVLPVLREVQRSGDETKKQLAATGEGNAGAGSQSKQPDEQGMAGGAFMLRRRPE